MDKQGVHNPFELLLAWLGFIMVGGWALSQFVIGPELVSEMDKLGQFGWNESPGLYGGDQLRVFLLGTVIVSCVPLFFFSLKNGALTWFWRTLLAWNFISFALAFHAVSNAIHFLFLNMEPIKATEPLLQRFIVAISQTHGVPVVILITIAALIVGMISGGSSGLSAILIIFKKD